MKLLRENLLQAGEAGQAVFLLELGLALDERKRVLGKVFGDVVALGGETVETSGLFALISFWFSLMEQDTGIEPASSAWEADVLPMY